MKTYKYIPFAGLLILSLSLTCFPKSGTISTTKTGTISTTRTGTISTTATGTISTTRRGTISTTCTPVEADNPSVFYRSGILDLFVSMLATW
jgi:hypothetical protein